MKKWFWIVPMFTALLILTGCRSKETGCRHRFTKIEAIKSTCMVQGMAAYYVCDLCGSAYWDETGAWPLEDKDELELPLSDHSLMKVVMEPSDTSYWHCEVCGKDFYDPEGKREIKPIY